MIPMQLNSDVLERITWLSGSPEILNCMQDIGSLPPFSDSVIDFLSDLSKELMGDGEAKSYPDVITFAFWIRKGSVFNLRKRFSDDEEFRLGKGIVFHIAPSNVPVNFAYSLVTGLLTGNANIVRIPGKDFSQVSIIINALNRVLERHEKLKKYILCVRYERDREINDLFSSIADMRVVWGGDSTIAELRKSPMPPRSGEITFADRFSIAVIDSDTYMAIEDKKRAAEDFYNDTYLSDQNACTSPQIVIWTGNKIKEAKDIFWSEEQKIVKERYTLHSIRAVNKFTRVCMAAVLFNGVHVEPHSDNFIIRVHVSKLTDKLMDQRENSGFFYEYECGDILELKPICNDKRCQTISYIGDKGFFLPLLKSGIKGVDRIVPVGKTMDFDLIWDGYDLTRLLTREVVSI